MAYENWTTWTEVDADGDITVAANQLTVTSMTNDDACVYKDYGAGYFSGDFTHLFDFRVTAETGSDTIEGLVCYSNIAACTYADLTTDVLTIYGYDISGTETACLLLETSAGVSNIGYNLALGTTYYAKVVRSSGTVTLYVYSDSERTSQLASCSRAFSTSFRYISCAYQGWGSEYWSGDIYNLDLGLAESAATHDPMWFDVR